MALIFFVSAQPDLPHAPKPVWDLLLKKAAHAIEYGVLYLLLWQALDRRPSFVALAWALTVLYAASDEFHQTFVPGRKGRWMDLVIDSIGASVAALAVWASVRRRH
jgi:VanZ family protein